jgi:hypothetical protein
MNEQQPNFDDSYSLWALRVAAAVFAAAAVVPVFNTVQHEVHILATPAVAEAAGPLSAAQQANLDQWVSDEKSSRTTSGLESAFFILGALYFGSAARRESRKIKFVKDAKQDAAESAFSA